MREEINNLLKKIVKNLIMKKAKKRKNFESILLIKVNNLICRYSRCFSNNFYFLNSIILIIFKTNNSNKIIKLNEIERPNFNHKLKILR